MPSDIEYEFVCIRLVKNHKVKIPINAICKKLQEVTDVVNSISETHIELIYLLPINVELAVGDKVTTNDEFDGSRYEKPVTSVIGIVTYMLEDNENFIVVTTSNNREMMIEKEHLIKIG